MRQCLRYWVWAAVLSMAALANAAEPPGAAPAAGTSVRCPAWARAVLAVRNVGGTFDRAAQYCDAVVTNSGALARLTATSWLFPLPLDAGIEKEGPALVFLLDPGAGGAGLGDKAYILPVADAAAAKATLQTALGATEQDGVLKIVLPQGFKEPDRILLVRLAGKSLLAAPNEALLGALAQVVGAGAAGGVPLSADSGPHGGALSADSGTNPPRAVAPVAPPLVDPHGPDAVLVVNLALLRRQGEAQLEDALNLAIGLAAAAWPGAGAQLQALQPRLLARSRELDRLEVRLSATPEALALEAILHALPDTDLARRWEGVPAPPTGAWLPWLTEDTAFYVAGALPAGWMPNEDALRNLLLRLLPPADAAAQAATARATLGCGAFLGQLGGEAACSVLVDPEGDCHPLVMFGTRGPGEPRASSPAGDAGAAFEAGLAGLIGVLSEVRRTQAGLKADAPAPLTLQKVAADGPPVRQVVQVRDPVWAAELRPWLEDWTDWPVVISYRTGPTGLAASWGRGANRLLSGPEPVLAPDAPARAALRDLPPGTAGWGLFRPATGLRAVLKAATGLTAVARAQVLEGLADTPLTASWGSGGGRVWLRLNVPSSGLHTGLECYVRLLRQGFDPLAELEAGRPPGVRNVTAPPPGP